MQNFLKFYIKASTKYNLQSPFLHHFIKSCIDNKDQYYAYQYIRQWAGNKIAFENPGKIIHKMVNFLQPQLTLVVGKEFTLSWYAKLADTRKPVIFIWSGDKMASPLMKMRHLADSPEIEVGAIEELTSIIESNQKVFLIVEDMNGIIQEFLEKRIPGELNKLVIFLVRKHRNKHIERFWSHLSSSNLKGLFVDFYTSGIYFRLPELSSEKIAYIPYPLKPWKIGLFGK